MDIVHFVKFEYPGHGAFWDKIANSTT